MVTLLGDCQPAFNIWLPPIVVWAFDVFPSPLVWDTWTGLVNAVATSVTAGVVLFPVLFMYLRLTEISLSLEIITQVNLTPWTILIPWIPGTRDCAVARENVFVSKMQEARSGKSADIVLNRRVWFILGTLSNINLVWFITFQCIDSEKYKH